ncbi:Aste57867_15536 [Aphanomyces stellatus]|uniref:Aste57867_15536 protein n=1 Tax=Aphanomyces stellatus TaxID=120398 RepID=A0A485L3D0_9STRA|nr:hypothetical protein As57867_015480 [Aphanomyces stellatus]VFT92338.1 Aste57867_15536 [Aphanomyces stellatus]
MSFGLWQVGGALGKWATEFHECVTDLIADGGLTFDLSEKISLLEKLADALESEPETIDVTAKGSMLALWILVVTHVDQISIVSYKYMCFRLMSATLRRPEFKLQRMHFDFNSQVRAASFSSPSRFYLPQDVRTEGDREAWRLIHLYRKLLSDTFVYSSKLLLHGNQSPTTQAFCATVAAHAFFVFPLIQAPFVDVSTWRYCHHQATHVSPLHLTLDAVVRAMSLQTHTEFMDVTPDLFHWGWLAKPSDPTILPDDSTWRFLVDSNDGHLFCLFVRAFHDVVAAAIAASDVHVSVVTWEMVPGYLKLLQLFGLVLYDTLTASLASSSPITKSQELFPITTTLGDVVLETATALTANGHVIQLYLPIAIAAISTASSSSISASMAAGLHRTLRTMSQWIQLCATDSPHLSLNAIDLFQNVLLYPSYVNLRDAIASVVSILPAALAARDDDPAVSILVWAHTHMQRISVDEKDVLAAALLVHFYALFLHWSPRVRTCMHQILVYQLFRHARHHLHLASDPAVLDAWRADAETLAPFCFDKPALFSDSPSLILDLSLASKVDTYVYALQQSPQGLYPEALDIFVHVSLMEYGHCLGTYYDTCAAVETKRGAALEPTDVLQGPDLNSLVAQHHDHRASTRAT